MASRILLWEWSAGKELLGHRGDDRHQHPVLVVLGPRNDLLPAGPDRLRGVHPRAPDSVANVDTGTVLRW